METTQPKTRRRKRKLQIGQVFEIQLVEGKNRFARVIAKDRIGWLFEFFNEPPRHPSSLDQILSLGRRFCAHINEYSIGDNWVKVGDAVEKEYSLPTMFNGHPSYSWEITENGITRTVDASSVSFDELVDRGFVSRTLWIADKVEDCLAKDKIPRFALFSKLVADT